MINFIEQSYWKKVEISNFNLWTGFPFERKFLSNVIYGRPFVICHLPFVICHLSSYLSVAVQLTGIKFSDPSNHRRTIFCSSGHRTSFVKDDRHYILFILFRLFLLLSLYFSWLKKNFLLCFRLCTSCKKLGRFFVVL